MAASAVAGGWAACSTIIIAKPRRISGVHHRAGPDCQEAEFCLVIASRGSAIPWATLRGYREGHRGFGLRLHSSFWTRRDDDSIVNSVGRGLDVDLQPKRILASRRGTNTTFYVGKASARERRARRGVVRQASRGGRGVACAVVLFVSKGRDRVDARGAHGRDGARAQRDEGGEQRDGCEGDRVEPFDTKQ